MRTVLKSDKRGNPLILLTESNLSEKQLLSFYEWDYSKGEGSADCNIYAQIWEDGHVTRYKHEFSSGIERFAKDFAPYLQAIVKQRQISVGDKVWHFDLTVKLLSEDDLR